MYPIKTALYRLSSQVKHPLSPRCVSLVSLQETTDWLLNAAVIHVLAATKFLMKFISDCVQFVKWRPCIVDSGSLRNPSWFCLRYLRSFCLLRAVIASCISKLNSAHVLILWVVILTNASRIDSDSPTSPKHSLLKISAISRVWNPIALNAWMSQQSMKLPSWGYLREFRVSLHLKNTPHTFDIHTILMHWKNTATLVACQPTLALLQHTLRCPKWHRARKNCREV